MLYEPLEFKNGLILDASVDSGAQVSAIFQKKVNTIKQQAPPISSRWAIIPTFNIK